MHVLFLQITLAIQVDFKACWEHDLWVSGLICCPWDDNFFLQDNWNTCLSECVTYGMYWTLFLVALDMLQTHFRKQKEKEQKKVWRNDEVPLNLLSEIWTVKTSQLFASLQLEHSFGHPMMWWDWAVHAFSQLGVPRKEMCHRISICQKKRNISLMDV